MDWNLILSSALSDALGPTMVIYALAAIGLNVHFGYTGLLNFGQAAFVAVASYSLSMTVATFGAPFWLGIPIGLLGAVVLALLLGVPTLRLRADYLAIVTIAASEIVRRLARSVTLSEWTGGSDGVRGFSRPFFDLNPFADGWRLEWPSALSFLPTIGYSRSQLWVATIGWILVAVSLLIVWLAMRSPWGRVLKAIREDEDAVRSLGKNVFAYKMQSLVVGGVLGSLAGFVWALSRANVQPDNFSTDFTFYLYAIVILGGAARVFGPLLGAAIFWFLISFLSGLLQALDQLDVVPDSVLSTTKVGPVTFMLIGIGMILLLVFRPQGIFGDKREISLDVR
jgi:branched-chain amino acid transport system permease protein